MTIPGQWLPAIILLIFLQLALMLAALYDLWGRREVSRLPRSLWAIIIVIFNFIGPISYLLLGRRTA